MLDSLKGRPYFPKVLQEIPSSGHVLTVPIKDAIFASAGKVLINDLPYHAMILMGLCADEGKNKGEVIIADLTRDKTPALRLLKDAVKSDCQEVRKLSCSQPFDKIFNSVMNDIDQQWNKPSKYDLLHNNCQHFVNKHTKKSACRLAPQTDQLQQFHEVVQPFANVRSALKASVEEVAANFSSYIGDSSSNRPCSIFQQPQAGPNPTCYYLGKWGGIQDWNVPPLGAAEPSKGNCSGAAQEAIRGSYYHYSREYLQYY